VSPCDSETAKHTSAGVHKRGAIQQFSTSNVILGRGTGPYAWYPRDSSSGVVLCRLFLGRGFAQAGPPAPPVNAAQLLFALNRITEATAGWSRRVGMAK
jgi:uncharacterized protein YodC (DUF2158 family)